MNEQRILLVDDEEDLLDVLGEYLAEQGLTVTTAQSGAQALELLASYPFDLLLSDINMPGMKGFELLQRASRDFPHVKRALITAYDVRDYLRLAQEHDVGNIITKTTPFNFDETLRLIRNILTEDVFGLEKYVNGPLSRAVLRRSLDIESMMNVVLDAMPEPNYRRKFKHGLGEMLINAVYYGARNEKGDRKQEWNTDVELGPEEEIIVTWGFDENKAGVAITDQKGRLSKQDVLYWLERNTARNEAGRPMGFFDKHGKGLFITREINDRFIVNVKKGACTEIILINYREGIYDGHRPLWIHEFQGTAPGEKADGDGGSGSD